MSAADVRDVLDLPSATPNDGIRRPPAKKQKTVEKRPDGITRELYALLGEHPPPVALKLTESRFKERPRWMEKAKPWEWKKFTNPARTDDLELGHWARKPKNNGMLQQEGEAEQKEYFFARYNIKPNIIEYTDGEYESVLRSDSWSREETDYLLDLCREYDLRFFIIADRYEFIDSIGNKGKQRSLEDIKARYYSVCRNIMALRKPMGQMSPADLTYYNLLNFDKEKEVARKRMATILFNRTPEEIKEEEFLLIELKRILANQEKLLEERQDLFSRLDVPQSVGSISAYSGSQGLHNLSMLMAKSDNNKKRKSIALSGNNGTGNGLTPQNIDSAQPSPVTATLIEKERPTKETSTPKNLADMQHKKSLRTLSPEEERKYGVQYHEKLGGGVYCRSMKVGLIKGASQPKVQTALQELGIPARLVMATQKTCGKIEQLNQVVNTVLDARKHMEKLEQEIRVEKNRLECLRADNKEKEGSIG